MVAYHKKPAFILFCASKDCIDIASHFVKNIAARENYQDCHSLNIYQNSLFILCLVACDKETARKKVLAAINKDLFSGFLLAKNHLCHVQSAN